MTKVTHIIKTLHLSPALWFDETMTVYWGSAEYCMFCFFVSWLSKKYAFCAFHVQALISLQNVGNCRWRMKKSGVQTLFKLACSVLLQLKQWHIICMDMLNIEAQHLTALGVFRGAWWMCHPFTFLHTVKFCVFWHFLTLQELLSVSLASFVVCVQNLVCNKMRLATQKDFSAAEINSSFFPFCNNNNN